MNIVDKTWNELGHKVECTATRILVRTDPKPDKIGLIYLPTKQTEFYGVLKGSDVTVTATVLNVSKNCIEGLKPGNKILFKRLFFAPYKKMEDNTFVGWVPEEEIDCIEEL